MFFLLSLPQLIFTMPTIFDHISAKSKTAIRRTLRVSLEGQFEQAKTLIDELCGKMYAKIIPHKKCDELYKDIKCLLNDINSAFANYANSRKCAIGVDADGDISFINRFLNEYKLKINQLKDGIEEAKLHECRFDAKSKQHLIFIYQSFSSYSEDIAVQFDTLQSQYNELESVIYGPQSDEVVLNRFNRHFFNVTKSVESGIKGNFSKAIRNSFNIFHIDIFNGLSYIEFSYKPLKSKSPQKALREAQAKLLNPISTFLDGRFIDLCDKPQELAREIYEKQIDNSLVEELMTRLCLWNMLSNECVPQNEKFIRKRRRGRPIVDKFYEEYLDLNRLGDFMRETFQKLYHTSIEDDMRQEGQLSYAFLLALLIALNGGDPNRVYGKVACFCRFLKNTFGVLVRTLRSFQYYINKFVEFLQERNNGKSARTMSMSNIKRVIIRNKKFFSSEQLVSQIGRILTQNALFTYC